MHSPRGIVTLLQMTTVTIACQHEPAFLKKSNNVKIIIKKHKKRTVLLPCTHLEVLWPCCRWRHHNWVCFDCCRPPSAKGTVPGRIPFPCSWRPQPRFDRSTRSQGHQLEVLGNGSIPSCDRQPQHRHHRKRCRRCSSTDCFWTAGPLLQWCCWCVESLESAALKKWSIRTDQQMSSYRRASAPVF